MWIIIMWANNYTILQMVKIHRIFLDQLNKDSWNMFVVNNKINIIVLQVILK